MLMRRCFGLSVRLRLAEFQGADLQIDYDGCFYLEPASAEKRAVGPTVISGG